MIQPDSEPLAAVASASKDLSPFPIGAKRSFVPALGKIVWELPKTRAAQIPFDAHIYRTTGDQNIGYLRIPHYFCDPNAANVFEELIAHFERSTVALVLDQVNNPGGSMFYMYALLATLTAKPLTLPRHQLALTDQDASLAAAIVKETEAGKTGPSERPGFEELVAYSRFVLSEIKEGRKKLTNPVHLGGVTEIPPARIHYTKQIVVLINERDFSAAEFLAAILQDNERATLFGTRTAGAGGCIRPLTTPNDFGMTMTVTWTIAWRTKGQPIQDLGVVPDVAHNITEDDIHSDFASYRNALLATIDSLLSPIPRR